MINLDQIDAKIIKLLLLDGRTSYDELADECGVSKNAIWKRCRMMEKKDIIKGATIQMNFSNFGFDALATLLISVNAPQLEEAMELIGKVTEVRAYRQYNSVFNIRATATLRNLNELDHVKQVIKQKVPTLSLKTYIWTGVRNIPENLNLANTSMETSVGVRQNSAEQTSSLSVNKAVIDGIDEQIVSELALDGRKSFTQISKKINVSTDTVVKRYNKLRQGDKIKVSIQINPNVIGYASILDFNMSFMTESGLSETVVESLTKIPNIIIITKTSGDYDLQVTAMVRDISELFAIQDQIAKICGITKIETSARKIPNKWPTPRQYISTF